MARLPVVMEPSGILEWTARKQRTSVEQYIPPKAECVPGVDQFGFHLFRFDNETEDGEEVKLETGRSYVVFGRDKESCDVVIENGLASKQHAVLQFMRTDGEVRLYIMDMGSTNGCFLNDEGEEISKNRYLELRNGDKLRFGDPENQESYVLVKE